MCLIIVKNKGVKLNKVFFEYCEIAAISNSDGAGYALKRASKDFIIVNKGFKKAMDLIVHLESLKIQEDDELIVHFRAATYGSRTKANCHPFVICDKLVDFNLNEERLLKNTVDPVDVKFAENHPIAFMHNGMMYEWEKDFGDKDFSDTRNFAKRFLSLIHNNKSVASNFYEIKKDEHPTDLNKKFGEAFPKYKHQKFAFLSAKYGVLTLGDFVKDSYGFYHSNSGAMYKRQTSLK